MKKLYNENINVGYTSMGGGNFYTYRGLDSSDIYYGLRRYDNHKKTKKALKNPNDGRFMGYRGNFSNYRYGSDYNNHTTVGENINSAKKTLDRHDSKHPYKKGNRKYYSHKGKYYTQYKNRKPRQIGREGLTYFDINNHYNLNRHTHQKTKNPLYNAQRSIKNAIGKRTGKIYLEDIGIGYSIPQGRTILYVKNYKNGNPNKLSGNKITVGNFYTSFKRESDPPVDLGINFNGRTGIKPYSSLKSTLQNISDIPYYLDKDHGNKNYPKLERSIKNSFGTHKNLNERKKRFMNENYFDEDMGFVGYTVGTSMALNSANKKAQKRAERMERKKQLRHDRAIINRRLVDTPEDSKFIGWNGQFSDKRYGNHYRTWTTAHERANNAITNLNKTNAKNQISMGRYNYYKNDQGRYVKQYPLDKGDMLGHIQIPLGRHGLSQFDKKLHYHNDIIRDRKFKQHSMDPNSHKRNLFEDYDYLNEDYFNDVYDDYIPMAEAYFEEAFDDSILNEKVQENEYRDISGKKKVRGAALKDLEDKTNRVIKGAAIATGALAATAIGVDAVNNHSSAKLKDIDVSLQNLNTSYSNYKKGIEFKKFPKGLSRDEFFAKLKQQRNKHQHIVNFTGGENKGRYNVNYNEDIDYFNDVYDDYLAEDYFDEIFE